MTTNILIIHKSVCLIIQDDVYIYIYISYQQVIHISSHLYKIKSIKI